MAVVKKKTGAMSPKSKAKVETVSDDLTLPKELSVPHTELGDYSWLLFGRKKVGKTMLSSKFPRTFHMMLEPGGKALKIFQRPVSKWSEFTGYVKLLEKDKSFNTQVVDTVDILYKQCSDAVCRKMGIDHPADEDWGKGWSAVRDEFTRWIQRLINNGKGTIFISHAVEREIKQRTGGSYHTIQPTLQGMARDILEGMVDIFAYFDYEGDQRILTIRGDESVAAGNRLENHFRWEGREVPKVYMGASADEGYRNLVACFNNKYKYEFEAENEDTPIVAVKKLKVAK